MLIYVYQRLLLVDLKAFFMQFTQFRIINQTVEKDETHWLFRGPRKLRYGPEAPGLQSFSICGGALCWKFW